MLVVDFLEAVQIENDEAQRRAVAAGAIDFLFKGFAKEAAVVEAGKRIGDSIKLQLFQLVYSITMGMRKSPAEVSTSMRAVFKEICRSICSLSSRRRMSISSQSRTH